MNRRITATAIAATVVLGSVLVPASAEARPHVTHHAHAVTHVKHLTAKQRHALLIKARARAAVTHAKPIPKPKLQDPPLPPLPTCDPETICSPPPYVVGTGDPADLVCEPMGATGTYCYYVKP
jgi:hypothetical protein